MKLSKKVRNELYPRNLLKMSPVCEKKENALLLRCLCLILFTSSSAGLVQEKIPPKKAIKNGFWYMVFVKMKLKNKVGIRKKSLPGFQGCSKKLFDLHSHTDGRRSMKTSRI